MDDNAAQTNAAENPYLSITVPQVQAAFDTMYDAVHFLVEGKRASIKQIDKWLQKWEDKLAWITEKYRELLGKFDEFSGSLNTALSLDVAKEAWELFQDFPILRRYLGEANYWMLYDTIGLAATQGAAFTGDLSSAVKAALKAGVKALLAMTDGMMSLESYLGTISQYWGAFYVKTVPLPLLDSIVPNVTCTYFFKPEAPSHDGVGNPAPRLGGFLPIPTPIPNPDYVAQFPLRPLTYDRSDPTTWTDPENGLPKFLNINALYDALEYWGSSYSNETLPGVTSADPDIPALYKRRDYTRGDGESTEAHPLRVGSTFAQLDVSKTIVAYGGFSGDDEGTDSEKAFALFKKLWADDAFQSAMKRWSTAWDDARQKIVDKMKSVLDGHVPRLDTNGNIVTVDGSPVLGNFTSMSQLSQYSGDIRQEAYERLMGAMFKAHTTQQGLYELSNDVYLILKPLVEETQSLIQDYLKASGQPVTLQGMPLYLLYKSYELAALLAKAALVMRRTAPQGSKYLSSVDAIPLFSKCLLREDGSIRPTGVSQFIRIFPVEQLPDEGVEVLEGMQLCSIEADPDWWRTDDPTDTWASIPAFEEGDLAASWDTWAYSLVRPNTVHPMPCEFYKLNDGQVLRFDEAAQGVPTPIGTFESGAFSIPGAWSQDYAGSPSSPHMTCGFFIADDIDTPPTTAISAIISMMEESKASNDALEDEIADEVGYSVLKGRRPLAACFGVYGRLLGMKGWCFKAMPAAPMLPTSPTYNPDLLLEETFVDKYTRIPGSDLWYETEHPDKIVYKHSTFYSASRGMPYTVYHNYMAKETIRRGDEYYDFYVFPTESISIQELKDNSLGALRSIDAVGEDGRKWHYIVIKNAVPKCPKYVESRYWSIMDLVHELYLLAWGMSPFCGDNGERLAKLEDVLGQLGVSRPQFIGQLPGDGEDEEAAFEVKLFETYATRIERLVDSIYTLRDAILAATEAW